ncbi:MAG: N-acetylmuramoyl-L-alanine amidase [Brevirhabdus sp.]
MRRILILVLTVLMAGPVLAQQGDTLRAVARVSPETSRVELGRRGGTVELALSQPVPWRVFTLDDPKRLVVDFREVDWTGLSAADLSDMAPERVRFGAFRPGWSRLVLDLPGPWIVAEAGMKTKGETRVKITLEARDDATFAARAGAPPDGRMWPEPVVRETMERAKTRQDGSHPLVVVLDPGHGGVDPGAERDGAREAELTLTFARELRARLVQDGGMEVHLTRNEDVFVPLQARVSHARAVGADVFISLHADALAHGRAEGTTIYTLSDTASDNASEILAEREGRADLISGVDLTRQDDVVAGVLMDLARHETETRAEMLAGELVTGIRGALGKMHKRPHLRAGFSVLRAPDIPSVLIEIGFLSSQSDLEKMQDPKWRDSLAEGILSALELWAIEDAAAARLVRQ